MDEVLGEKTKIGLVRDFLSDQDIPDGVEAGLRIFGGDKSGQDACEDTTLLVKPSIRQQDRIASALQGITARGEAPLIEAVREATNDFDLSSNSPNKLIILTSGIDSCDSDWSEELYTLFARLELKSKPELYLIGINIEEIQKLEQLKEVAQITGAQYYDVKNKDDIQGASEVIRLGKGYERLIAIEVTETPTPTTTSTNTVTPIETSVSTPTPTNTPIILPTETENSSCPHYVLDFIAGEVVNIQNQAGQYSDAQMDVELQLPEEVTLQVGELNCFTFDAPPDEEIYLSFEGRTDWDVLGDVPSPVMALSVNGEPLTDKSLMNKENLFTLFGRPELNEINYYVPDIGWRLLFSPDYESNNLPGDIYTVNEGNAYRFVLNITDFVSPGEKTEIRILNPDEDWKVDLGGLTIKFQNVKLLTNQRIVFNSDRAGNEEIYVMNADGSDQTRLTNNDASDREASLSPDGSRIIFTSDRDGNEEIYVMDADGSDQTRLTNNTISDWAASWSPDGSRIVFSSKRDNGNWEIYVMNADGSDQTNLTNNEASDWQPHWSPDGSRIVFNSNRDGSRPEIYVMDADGSNQTRLTNNAISDWAASWSPDSKRIAFNSDRDGNWEIYVMNADGSDQTRLTNNDTSDCTAIWSPDGSRIVFSSDRGGNWEINVMNADGFGQINLINNEASNPVPRCVP